MRFPTSVLLAVLLGVLQARDGPTRLQQCSELEKYQYTCRDPPIDTTTQQPIGCQPDNSVLGKKGSQVEELVSVRCEVAPGIKCEGVDDSGEFERVQEDGCRYSTGKSHSTALLLSVFLGLLGVDRFYLGYYAMGVVKLCSLGGLFVLYLVDVVLIALQLLGPADGSDYYMPYYGPRVTPVRFSNETYMTSFHDPLLL